MAHNIFESLDADWMLVTRSDDARAACRRWDSDLPIAGCVTPDDILHRTRRGVGAGRADLVLAALAKRAPTDTMAARTLLQCLVPGMISLACRHGAPADPDVADEVVAIALERIRTYPYARRPRAIAANVLLDTHQRLYLDQTKRPVPMEDFIIDAPVVDEPVAAYEVRDLVDIAVRCHAIDREEATLVLAPVLGPHDPEAEARAAGIKARSVARRRQRALRRIVEFAQRELSA